MVVVPRADETPEAEQAPELFVALPAPGDVASFSSTKIRRLAEVNLAHVCFFLLEKQM